MSGVTTRTLLYAGWMWQHALLLAFFVTYGYVRDLTGRWQR